MMHRRRRSMVRRAGPAQEHQGGPVLELFNVSRSVNVAEAREARGFVICPAGSSPVAWGLRSALGTPPGVSYAEALSMSVTTQRNRAGFFFRLIGVGGSVRATVDATCARGRGRLSVGHRLGTTNLKPPGPPPSLTVVERRALVRPRTRRANLTPLCPGGAIPTDYTFSIGGLNSAQLGAEPVTRGRRGGFNVAFGGSDLLAGSALCLQSRGIALTNRVTRRAASTDKAPHQGGRSIRQIWTLCVGNPLGRAADGGPATTVAGSCGPGITASANNLVAGTCRPGRPLARPTGIGDTTRGEFQVAGRTHVGRGGQLALADRNARRRLQIFLAGAPALLGPTPDVFSFAQSCITTNGIALRDRRASKPL